MNLLLPMLRTQFTGNDDTDSAFRSSREPSSYIMRFWLSAGPVCRYLGPHAPGRDVEADKRHEETLKRIDERRLHV